MNEFYGTADGLTDYHELRGRDISSYTDDQKDAALLVASEWLDGVYMGQWGGYKLGGASQVREWPRTGVIDIYGYAVPSDVVPWQVENATYEVALRQLQSPGSLNVDFTPSQYKRVAIEGAVSVEYASVNAGSVQKQIPVIGQILAPLLNCNSGNALSGKVARA